MTGGPTRPQPQPLLGADRAGELLDRVIYEQVLECIDLEALHQLEQSITLIAGDLDGVGSEQAGELARALLDRALLRLPDDARHYLRAIDFLACDGCELCEEEARPTGPSRGSGRRRRLRPES